MKNILCIGTFALLYRYYYKVGSTKQQFTVAF